MSDYRRDYGPQGCFQQGAAAYEKGKRIRFPFTGNTYRIVAVDHAAQTVTLLEPFGDPTDPDDWTAHSFDDLASADAQVLP